MDASDTNWQVTKETRRLEVNKTATGSKTLAASTARCRQVGAFFLVMAMDSVIPAWELLGGWVSGFGFRQCGDCLTIGRKMYRCRDVRK